MQHSRTLSHLVLASTFFLTSMAYADLTISGNDTRTHKTSQDGNITVTNTGVLSVQDRAIMVDTPNTLIMNSGKVELSGISKLDTSRLRPYEIERLERERESDKTMSTMSVNAKDVTIHNKKGGTINVVPGDKSAIYVDRSATGFTLINDGTISASNFFGGISVYVPFNITNNGVFESGGVGQGILTLTFGQEGLLTNSKSGVIRSKTDAKALSLNGNIIANNDGQILRIAGSEKYNVVSMSDKSTLNNSGIIQNDVGSGIIIRHQSTAESDITINNTGTIQSNTKQSAIAVARMEKARLLIRVPLVMYLVVVR